MQGGVYRFDPPPQQATPHVAALPGASVDNPPSLSSVLAGMLVGSWSAPAPMRWMPSGIAAVIDGGTLSASGFWIIQDRRRRR